MTATHTDQAFALRLRRETGRAHRSAEGAGYLAALTSGQLDREGYALLVAQHYFIYEVLESAAEVMRADPVAGPFAAPELTRLPELVADLEFLLGAGWRDRIEATPGTLDYRARMTATCFGDPAGFVAHHYTRYLGDLSGGFHIGDAVRAAYGLGVDGTRFYRFDTLGDPDEFKNRYRALLDAAPWDRAVQDRLIAEVLVAYDLNNRVFADLHRLTSS
ncbi:biliverdin-producing heme oxygenase [Catenuloplanes atrovinosus]|uniref:Heme oxygenase n=1 Tax=Catenuloplanes atrovinosus TaxID=137266 RepID=A0AAE4CDQ4_9ACTN|nr:biliverdin-producing heme oxygenase [Catenuloplanes atrovinosus]MDR7280856.1 heme oxygenase [Catenuloplanes atrovinosus]